MRINIKYKLSFIFIIMLISVLLSLFILIRWSFDRGFKNHLANLERQRLTVLVQKIEERHTDTNSLRDLEHDKRAWRRLLRSSITPDMPEDMIITARQGKGMRMRDQGPRNSMRHEQGPPPKHLKFLFDYRVNLLDIDGHPIIGRGEGPPIEVQLPIKSGATIIGYLQLIQIPDIKDTPHRNFVRRQITRFGLIVLLVIILSSTLVIFISGRTVAPIRLINDSVRKLASGDFTARSNITSNDELGTLAQDINQLALTLDKNEQHRRQWVADISHELRTPVAVLRSHIEAIQDGIRDTSEKNMDVMHKETRQLERIINDLYDLSMSDIGALNYAMEKVNLLEIIDQSISFYESAFDEKQIKLTTPPHKDTSIFISADRNRLAQLFKNLLENSLKYTDNGGNIQFHITTDKSTATLTVEDSAPGVPPEHLPHLFDRFYRVEKSRNKDTGGTGLGLSIVKQIIDAHQGTINVSESKLGGICMTISLPLYRG